MKKKILLVEYAASTIDIIKEILSNPVFELTIVNEGEAAKKYLAKISFDLLITAAMLPKFHGFNLSHYAAENYPGTKIIIISDIYKGMDYKHQAITQYKADDFFEKPFNKKEFKKRAFELLDIREEELSDSLLSTTMQIPVSDTKKVPIFKKMEEKEKKMTSEDLFGDIIEKVQDPSYEIELDDDFPQTPGGDEEQAKTIEIPPPPSAATQKIDMELLDLIKDEKETKGKRKKTGKFKKIEADISKKFEDTLSGLGLGDRKTAPKQTSKKTKVPDKDKTDEVGDYEILGLIGRGGMAEIYKAKKKGVKGFEKIIALKKILSGYGTDAKFIEMFVDEAKIAAELSHPNIVEIYDLGEKDDYYFIAMEYVSGKDLRLILQKLAQTGTTLPEEYSIYLVIKILEALNYAHSARDSSGKSLEIVHRDVSPPNILVSYGGNIKLTDFGVSKASIKVHQTLAGALKGKLLYMSPEQARGEDNLDHRSDLYSAATILFELITGEKLFMDSSEIAMLKKVQEGEIVKPSQIKKDIDPELEAIILKSLDKNIEKRYQKAADMIKDLNVYMKQNYDNFPEAGHIAHFICDLFKDEIIKEGLEINLKPIPYPIKRIKKEAQEKKKEKYTSASTEKLKVKKNLQPQDVPEEDYLKEEEFRPIIEIDLDEDKNKPEKTSAEDKQIRKHKRDYKHAYAYEPEQVGKKKKNLLWLIIFIVMIVVLATIITYLIIDSTSSGRTEPAAGLQPAEKKSMPAVSRELPKPGSEETPKNEDKEAPTDTDTDTDTLTNDKISRVPDKKAVKVRPEPIKVESDPQTTQTIPTAGKKELKHREEMAPKTMIRRTTGISKPKTEPIEDRPAAIVEKKAPEEIKPPKVKIPEKEIVKEGDLVGLPEVDTQPVPVSTPFKVTRSIRRLLLANQRVLVSFLVDHKGNVETVKLIQKSSMKKLNSLVIETIKKWKFKPATKDNKKVKVWKNKWLAIKK